jgi:O-glycosyl hydrolase
LPVEGVDAVNGYLPVMMRKTTMLLVLLLTGIGQMYGQTRVTIDPTVRYQRFEGWGVSLAWWAHIVGQKASARQLDELLRWLTAKDELNMRVFRFNIGGGDAPGHVHMRKDAQMPGYRPEEGGPYDWDADSAQRRVLLALHRLRPDAVFEGESYSPPYWMTISGCTSGGDHGTPNLRDDCYDRFADYLTEVVKHYKTTYGIVFRTLAPVNEPFSDWWTKGHTQEGCAFTEEQQVRLIRALRASLQAKGLSAFTTLSLNDANSIDECVRGLEGKHAAELLSGISQINTHSYAGSARAALDSIAMANGKRLWQSESGPLDRRERGLDNYLLMDKRIITDMRELKPTVWCDWQYMSGGGPRDVWGLVGYRDSSFSYQRTKGFYCREQFSRFIVPGSICIKSDTDNTLSALSPDGKHLMVVMVNQGAVDLPMTIDLAAFRRVKNEAVFLTDATRDCAQQGVIDGADKRNVVYTLPPRSVVTLVFRVAEAASAKH